MERAPVQGDNGAQAIERDRLDALVEAMETPRPLADVREAYATVESAAGGALVVRVGDRPVKAQRAVSCLVEPAVGDRVLVALSAESFVLAVLVKGEQRGPGLTLSVEGDVTLRARGGKLAVVADEAVSLTSGAKVQLCAPELEVRAMKTSFFSASLSYVGRTIDGEIDRLKLAAHSVDRAIDRVSERIKRSFRTIEEIEQVRAKELDVDVEGNVTVHADSTLLSAEKLVKVDGEQIHLG
jgi:hypothetical protein